MSSLVIPHAAKSLECKDQIREDEVSDVGIVRCVVHSVLVNRAARLTICITLTVTCPACNFQFRSIPPSMLRKIEYRAYLYIRSSTGCPLHLTVKAIVLYPCQYMLNDDPLKLYTHTHCTLVSNASVPHFSENTLISSNLGNI